MSGAEMIGAELSVPELCALTGAELDALVGACFERAVAGKAPADGKVYVQTLGAPGVGKSSLDRSVVPGAAGAAVLDSDSVLESHPRRAAIGRAADAAGGTALADCVAQVAEQVISAVLGRLFDAEMSVVLQSHQPRRLLDARLRGYRTVLLFVGAPLATAQYRARRRSADSGRLLGQSLADQDSIIERLHYMYAFEAPLWAQWAGEFVLCRNGGRAPEFRAPDHVPSGKAADRQDKKIAELMEHVAWAIS